MSVAEFTFIKLLRTVAGIETATIEVFANATKINIAPKYSLVYGFRKELHLKIKRREKRTKYAYDSTEH